MKKYIKKCGIFCFLFMSTLAFSDKPLDAKLEPVVKKGKLHSFVISDIRSGTPYERVGLQDGDQLLSIDGIRFNSMKSSILALKRLSEPSVKMSKISLVRDGKSMIITDRK